MGSISSKHCYSIFLRHASLLQLTGVRGIPSVVAELGPGSSMGTGFAALIAGAEKYYALDLANHSTQQKNIDIFDELVTLFCQRAEIPAYSSYSKIFPDLKCYEHPTFAEIRQNAAFKSRIDAIRKDIVNGTGIYFEVAAPWMQSNIIQKHSVDWIFSHSVLEHVDNLAETYKATSEWLKVGGHVTHLIDFGSHFLTPEWNGHWALGDRMWSAIKGKRPYLLNREWCSVHLRLATENNFALLWEKRNKRFDGLLREEFSMRYQSMSDEDARTEMVFLISQLQK